MAPTFEVPQAGNLWVSLSWTPVPGATSYTLYYATSSAGATTASVNRVTSINATTVTLVTSGTTITTVGNVGTVGANSAALNNGAVTYFVVTALGSAGQSLASTFVSATPNVNTGLAPVVLQTPVAASGAVTLSWASVTGANSYNLYYGKLTTDATPASLNRVTGIVGTSLTLSASGTTVIASDGVVANGSIALDNGTDYYFVATPVGSGGEGGASIAVKATPAAATTAPLPPTLAAPAGGNNAVSLSWTTVAGSTSYNLYYATSPANATKGSLNKITGILGTSTRLTNSGTTILSAAAGSVVALGSQSLVNGTAYSFVVTAVNSKGESSASAVQTVTPSNRIGGAVLTPLATTIGNVSTFAGKSSGGSPKDGNGTAAVFYSPRGMTTDGQYLYIIEIVYSDSSIRKIHIDSKEVTTIQSSGVGFQSPRYITTDGTNLYFSTGSYDIRKVSIASGVISVVAGSTSTGNADGVGTAALVKAPSGVTTDGTNLYFADSDNNNIRKVVLSTGAVTTLAGPTGTSFTSGSVNATGIAARFSGPRGLTTDGTFLYVGDYNNRQIRKIEIATGVVTTLCGSVKPTGDLTLDGNYLYLVDEDTDQIQKVSLATGTVTSVAGTAGSSGYVDAFGTAAKFSNPEGIATDGTSLYVADTSNEIIRKIN